MIEASKCSVIEPSDPVCVCLLIADNGINKSIVQCYHLGNWGSINLQLMLPVQMLETVEHYIGSSVESETKQINRCHFAGKCY